MISKSHFHTIKQEKAPKILNLLVEIQKGDYTKYEYNHELGILEMDRVLYGPTYYPVNYCDVPGTWNDGDNDPLDAMVFCSGNLIPGVLVKGRVIGVMEMWDNGEKDFKIICVAHKDPRYEHVNTIDQLAPYEKKDMQTFNEIYKHAQTGPGTVKVGKFYGTDEAYKLIEESIKAYERKFPNP